MSPNATEKPIVLLVDDDRRIRSALKRMLRREGLDLLEASSAREALEILETTAIDLVVTDHKMPGGSGTDLLRVVRKRWRNAGRILLSGWTQEIPDAEIRAAAPDSIQSKPWNDAELKQAIRESLGSGS